MLELIGHTDISMTRYYQDVDLNDLRKITDALYLEKQSVQQSV